MIDSFKEAVFTFNLDKTCKLETSSVANSSFLLMTSVINMSSWKVVELDKSPLINIMSNGKTQMELFVTVKDKDVFFALGKETDPSYFLLKVVKN